MPVQDAALCGCTRTPRFLGGLQFFSASDSLCIGLSCGLQEVVMQVLGKSSSLPFLFGFFVESQQGLVFQPSRGFVVRGKFFPQSLTRIKPRLPLRDPIAGAGKRSPKACPLSPPKPRRTHKNSSDEKCRLRKMRGQLARLLHLRRRLQWSTSAARPRQWDPNVPHGRAAPAKVLRKRLVRLNSLHISASFRKRPLWWYERFRLCNFPKMQRKLIYPGPLNR